MQAQADAEKVPTGLPRHVAKRRRLLPKGEAAAEKRGPKAAKPAKDPA